MNHKELLKKFFGLDNENETIVEAWELFIDTRKAFRDVEEGVISKRERDSV